MHSFYIGLLSIRHSASLLSLTLVEAFQIYLLEKEFTIQAGHRAPKWLTRFKDNNNRQCSGVCQYNPFDSKFSIGKHRKGIDNANADALSRQAEIEGQSEPGEGGMEERQITHDTKGQRLHHMDPTNMDSVNL